jgi:hypothetical protein
VLWKIDEPFDAEAVAIVSDFLVNCVKVLGDLRFGKCLDSMLWDLRRFECVYIAFEAVR